MKLNVEAKAQQFTHEGAVAVPLDAERQLRRSVMACMLWEGTFYEEGEDIAARIGKLIPHCRPEYVATCAFEARSKMKLRHAPLLLVREMARHLEHKRLVAPLLRDVIQRADEITEFLAIYWKDKRQPVSAQVKKGLALAFQKFDEYSFAKYDRGGTVKLRDALFLSHAKPMDGKKSTTIVRKYLNGTTKELQRHSDSLFAKIVARTLATPDTWEVALSAGADKKESFERLMAEKKLYALAFLRNLRNMVEAGIAHPVIEAYGNALDMNRVLPFRFISAARATPVLEPAIERWMLTALHDATKLAGKTVIVVDNSGSMSGAVSSKSDINRSDAACALAILLREICTQCLVIGFGTEAAVIPARRGFALRDAIQRGPSGGTNTQIALQLAAAQGYDRIIVVTDEQSHQTISGPLSDKAYFINVATYQNGIGYGKWTHIDGWSESIIDFIREYEA